MNNEGLKRKVNSFQKRIINQKYNELFLKNNGGVNTNDLIVFYNSNKNSYKDDSSNIPEFKDVKNQVVDDYLVSKADLKSHYEKNISSYTKFTQGDTTVSTFEEVKDKVTSNYSLILYLLMFS